MTDNTPQRVDVERLAAHWREAAEQINAGPAAAAFDVCANELDAALPALLQQLADAMNAVNGLTEELESAEAKLAERDAEIGDWQNLLTAVIAPRSLPGLSVEYPKLWPFDGGQDAAMVAFALHTAIERAESAERAREESVELMREVLERDRVRYLNGECVCINHSRKAELEYESGTCPHQRIAAFLAANGGRDHG